MQRKKPSQLVQQLLAQQRSMKVERKRNDDRSKKASSVLAHGAPFVQN